MSTRVDQLAKELKISNEELINKLKAFDIEVTSEEDVLEGEEFELAYEMIKEEVIAERGNVISLSGKITVQDLANEMGKTVSEVIKELMMMGTMATINQEISFEIASLVATKFGFELTTADDSETEDEIEKLMEIEEDKEEDLKPRPPVVTVMGHVDHGKTTLVDELLKQSHTLDDRKELQERAMDSNDLEKERGITILAKNTAVAYNGVRINIMDTPGHADFGGEVERIMKMVDGVVLVVDAYEGTMPQTRFVLKKALEQDLVPIVVVNKIDKPSARPAEVVDEVLELFIELGADDDQLDFPVVYASAINGTSSMSDDPADQEHTMAPLFDTIIDHIPAPVDNSDEPLQFKVRGCGHSSYFVSIPAAALPERPRRGRRAV